MEFGFSPRQDRFREEVRTWLQQQRPFPVLTEGLHDQVRALREWQSTLAQRRLIGVHWPERWGGRGLSWVDNYIVQEEMALARAPEIMNRVGVNLVGPTLLEHGSDEQREWHLPGILNGDDLWCQLFSEPDAGSDLGALTTSATRTDGGWVVQGQKVWSSWAHFAKYGILLARTGSRREIGFFLLPMDQPGVTVRPLRQMTGSSEFTEVFLDRAFVPDHGVVGDPARGWSIMKSTLSYERTASPRQLIVHTRLLDDLMEEARHNGTDPVTRQQLAQMYIELKIYRLHIYAALSKLERNEPLGSSGSMVKLFWSEMAQRMHDISMRTLGIAGVCTPTARSRNFLYYRACTIIAGTSEIQRNTIGERILGLPAEPRGDLTAGRGQR